MVREKDLTAPYIYFKDNWIGFDDEISIKIKVAVKYSMLRNLGGVALWTVNDDDITGKCGYGPFHLLNTIHEVLSDSNATRNHDASLAVIEKYGNVERIVELQNEESDNQLECKRTGYLQHPKDCSRFYRCVKFDNRDKVVNKFQYACPTGLVFDEMNEICNWPSWSSSCQGSGEINIVPKKIFTCSSYDFGKGNFHGYQFKCPFNLAFDEEKLLCNWKWLVKGCPLNSVPRNKFVHSDVSGTTESSVAQDYFSQGLNSHGDEIMSRSDTEQQTLFVDSTKAEHRSESTRPISFARVIKNQVSSVIETIDSKIKQMFGNLNFKKRQDDGNRYINWFSSFSPFGAPAHSMSTKTIPYETNQKPLRHKIVGDEPMISIPVLEVKQESNYEKQRWNNDKIVKNIQTNGFKSGGDSPVLNMSPSKSVFVLSKPLDRNRQNLHKTETIPVPIFTVKNKKINTNNLQQIQRRPDGSEHTTNVHAASSRIRSRAPSIPSQQSFEMMDIKNVMFPTKPSTIEQKQVGRLVRPIKPANGNTNSKYLPNPMKLPQLPSEYILSEQVSFPKSANLVKFRHENVGHKDELNSNKPLQFLSLPQSSSNIDFDIRQIDLQPASVEDVQETDSYAKYSNSVLQQVPLSTVVQPNRFPNALLQQKVQPQLKTIGEHLQPQLKTIGEHFNQFAHNSKQIPEKVQPFTSNVYVAPKQSHYAINVHESKPRPVLGLNAISKFTTPSSVTKNGFIPVTSSFKEKNNAENIWKPNAKTLQTSGSSVEYSIYNENNKQKNQQPLYNFGDKTSPLITVDTKIIQTKLSQSSKKAPQLLIIPVPDNDPKAHTVENIEHMQSLYPDLFSNTFHFTKKTDATPRAVDVETTTANVINAKNSENVLSTQFDNKIVEENLFKSTSVSVSNTRKESSNDYSTTASPISITESKSTPKVTTAIFDNKKSSSEENLLVTQQNLSQSLYDSIQQVIAQHLSSQLKNVDLTLKSNSKFPISTTGAVDTAHTSATFESVSPTIAGKVTPKPDSDNIFSATNTRVINENDRVVNMQWNRQPSWYQYHHQISSLPVANASAHSVHASSIYPVYSSLQNRLTNSDLVTVTTLSTSKSIEEKSIQNAESQRLYYKKIENSGLLTEPSVNDKPIEILRNKSPSPHIQVYIVQGANRPEVKTRTEINEENSKVKVFVIDESNNRDKVMESSIQIPTFGKKISDTRNKDERYYYSTKESKANERLKSTTTEASESNANVYENGDVEYEDTIESSNDKLTATQSIPIPNNKKHSLQSIYNLHAKLRNFTENSIPESACSRPGLFQHPQDCNKFYECYWDKFINKYTLHSFECPVKLAFDSRIIGCSSATDSTIPPPPQQPSAELIKAELNGYFNNMDKDLDELLNAEEVKLWMQSTHDNVIKESVQRQWRYYSPDIQEVHSWVAYNPDKKEVISWEKYVNLTYPENLFDENDSNETLNALKIMFKRSERRWKLADRNNDTVLVEEEFVDFVHPEESDDEKVKEVLILEAVEDMDKDENGEISFHEYMSHMKAMASNEVTNDNEWLKVQENHFTLNLDKDKDGALNFSELKSWLIPEHDKHEAEGLRLISVVDHNKDGKLSREELMDGYETFMALLPPQFWQKFSDDMSPFNNEVHIYKREGLKWLPECVLSQHDLRVTSIDWARKSNRIVTCSADRNAYVWSFVDNIWKPTLVLLRINRAATCVRWSPKEDKFAVGSGAKLISVCYFEEANDWWVSKHIKKPIRSTVTCIDWHPNNVLLACGSTDYKAKIFSAFIKEVDAKEPPTTKWGGKLGTTGSLVGEYSSGGGGWVHDVGFSPDGNRLAWVSHDSTVSVVDANRGMNGHDCCPMLFKYDEHTGKLEFVDKIDKSQRKEVDGISAMKKFQNMDKRAIRELEVNGSGAGDSILDTVHQNTIKEVRVYLESKNVAEKISTVGLDGKMVFWELKHSNLICNKN
ncbi:actin-related protein 2/3 complex subunit 1A-like protein [Leptotrombidium deliense]|uniref:Arp2/3 complex 41 kDa subunit n=1 Tax=Leptotrombidium deliense TaxID=299467 RepID=A0A443SRP6_9ACAR|nr:actin-related protein 2/3 complex subunit 1A-like protein [Leptotrombidium deliense]